MELSDFTISDLQVLLDLTDKNSGYFKNRDEDIFIEAYKQNRITHNYLFAELNFRLDKVHKIVNQLNTEIQSQ